MDATRIYVNGSGWVKKALNAAGLRTPTALDKDEAKFGGTDDRPVRKPIGWRLTKVIDLDPPYDVDPMTGEDITQQTVVVPWKDCIVDAGDVREMTDPEKAARDAADAADKAQKEQAKQDAKEQSLKNREKAFKDLGVPLGVTFPVVKGEMDGVVSNLMGQIATLLSENKTKDAVDVLYKAVALLAYRVELGDDVYSPLLGDGGV